MNDRDPSRRDLSERELALAVEESLFDLFRSMARLPGAELEVLQGYSRHHAFPSDPMFKGVWDVRLSRDDVHAMAEEAIAWYRERHALSAFWWVGPTSEPEDIGSALEHHDFEPFEVDAQGQVSELDALDWSALERGPSDLRIERVADERGLEAFARAFVEAFAAPDAAGRAWVDATRALGVGTSPWDLYVGRLGRRPVATTILFCGAGVATVLGIGTVADERGRGVGAAITLAALDDARARGYRYAVLFATELGAPVYRRIGFRDANAAISRWLWRAERN